MSALLLLGGRTFASVRKHRNYRLYFTGQAISVCGTWMQDTALPWVVLQTTHSPTEVGLLIFFRYVPFALFGLYAGALADRVDNRQLLIWTQVASMVIAAALAVSVFTTTASYLFFVLATLGGTSAVFENASRNALIFQLVGRDELPNAVALITGLAQAARVVGPASAGVVIAMLGSGWCFALNSASFLAVLTGLLLMNAGELVPLDRETTRPKTLTAIWEGMAYTWRTRRVKVVLALVIVMSVAGFNFRVLLPVLAGKTLDAGAEGFGVLYSAFGSGAVLGALIAATIGRGSVKHLVASAAGFSIAVLALAPLRSTVGAALLLLAIGAAYTVWNSQGQMIVQSGTPDRLRGRVMSLFTFAFAGFAPLGALLAGWLASVGGTELALGVAGTAGIAATGLAAAHLARLRAASTSIARADRGPA